MDEQALKYMLLIYAEEQSWTEAERKLCYGESTDLAHELQAVRGGFTASARFDGNQRASS